MRYFTFYFIIILLILPFQTIIAQKFDTILISTHYGEEPHYKDGAHRLIDSTNAYVFSGLTLRGERSGEWTECKLGILERRLNYVNGILNGPAVDYYANGNARAVYSYKDGSWDGPYVKFGETNRLQSYQFYKMGNVVSERRSYNDSNVLQGDQLWPTSDSLSFNSAPCGGIYYSLSVEIDGGTPFNGNSWYANGKPEVICQKTHGIKNVVNFKRFDKNGNVNITGSYKYVNKGEEFCWYEYGKWKWYQQGVVVKEKTYE